MAKTAADYRIEFIQSATYGATGTKVKTFQAYEYKADQKAFVFVGGFTAPAKTANKDLWKVVAERE